MARANSAAYVNQLWGTANAAQAAENLSLQIQQQDLSTETRSLDALSDIAGVLPAASAIALSPPADQLLQAQDSVGLTSNGLFDLRPLLHARQYLLGVAIRISCLPD